ncbi:hypothetical protein DMUE_3593 [Dictyocoela muelleri]|nr:hypothetical protein DMUE_3593 [Dictyocoela muelleri]
MSSLNKSKTPQTTVKIKIKKTTNLYKNLVPLTQASLKISKILKTISNGDYSLSKAKELCNEIWELRDSTYQVPFKKEVLEFVEDNDQPSEYHKIIEDNISNLKNDNSRISTMLMNSEDVLKSIVNKYFQ